MSVHRPFKERQAVVSLFLLEEYEGTENKLGSQIPSLKNLVLRKLCSFKQNSETANKQSCTALPREYTASVYS